MIAAALEECEIEGCGRPAKSGRLCATHRRRKRLRLPMLAPIRSRARQLEEALTEAAIRYADAAAEDNAEFDAGKNMLVDAAKEFGRRDHHHRIQQGLWRRKAAGLPIGRPPKLTHAQAQAAVKKHGSRKRAARALGVSRATLLRALKRVSKGIVSRHPHRRG